MIRHAGLVALRLGGSWQGVLIEGPSGSGKSDLALRAIEAGFRLVADDRVLVWTSEGRNYGRAPDALAGLLESRGAGVLPAAAIPLLRHRRRRALRGLAGGRRTHAGGRDAGPARRTRAPCFRCGLLTAPRPRNCAASSSILDANINGRI